MLNSSNPLVVTGIKHESQQIGLQKLIFHVHDLLPMVVVEK